MPELKYESLHNHTKDSDGDLTHLELLRAAEQTGIGIMAFTDHDVVPDAATIKQLRVYRGPVKWLMGIEISSDLPKEMFETHGNSPLHILGLFVDPTNQALIEHAEKLKTSRVERMYRFIDHLTSLGFKITEVDIRQAAGHSLIGSPHMVKALQNYPENQTLIEKLLGEMKLAAERDPILKRKYDLTIAEGPKDYPYTLFMKSSSFKPVPKGQFGWALLDLDASVKLIHDAGGIAILAHWFFEMEKLPQEYLERLLSEKRLDGVETEIINLITQRSVEVESKLLKGMAERYDRLQIVCSDAHDAADLKHFASQPIAERSIGQTKRLIASAKPSLEWSNF